MSTPVPNQKKLYQELAQRVEQYAQLVDGLYSSLQKDAIQLATSVKYDSTKPFTFDDYPSLKTKFNEVLGQFYKDLYTTINVGTTDLWNRSNSRQDDFVNKILSYYDADPKEKRFVSRYFNNNDDALKAFQGRLIDGKFNLSQRIWNATYTAKSDIQDALSIGLSEGKSAEKLSQEVRQYLNEPDKLFRRVRNKFGNLKLSKNAARYKPGAGQYRSSYKNAMRLTRTETAMAYRKAEHLRWQSLDFILGYEVKRSHKMFPCYLCDSLQGKYPKDFVFTGWHPQCMCYTVPILMNYNDFWDTMDSDGIDKSKYISNTPSGFNKWVSNNHERIEKAPPYFITENNIK
jgi:hypothetical protein